MKKGIVRYNWIHCRKWIVTWTVLIFILSLISLLAAGSGNEIDSHENAGINLNSKIVTDKDTLSRETLGGSTEVETGTGSGTDIQESAGGNLGKIIEAPGGTDNPESALETLETGTGSDDGAYNRESTEASIKAETGTEKDTESRESIEKSMETETETKQDTGNQENLEENLETKKLESISIDNPEDPEENLGTKIETKQDTDDQQDIEKNPDMRIRAEKDTEKQEPIEKNLEMQTEAKDETSSQENIQENPETKVRAEKSMDNQESTEEDLDIETGAKDSKYYQESAGESPKTKTITEEDTDNQENTGKNLETGKVESYSTDNLESPDKDPEQKEKTKEDPESQGISEANLKLKINVDHQKDSSGNPGTKTEMGTGSCDGSKNLKIIEVKAEPEGEACSGIKSSRSGRLKAEEKTEVYNREKSLKTEGTKAEINIGGINWTYIPGCKELKPEIETGLWSSFLSERLENKELKPEIETGESSWNNLKFILSYPCSLRSFYTTHQSVKINYKGSEALKEQKVDIYLVKTCNLSLSEEADKNVTNDSTIRFEDIFNTNTEFYVQIPATLNDRGNLSPLTLGPLPEGSYWVLVTLAGNETKAPEPEKTILLANHFEVLRYEMEAETPHTLEAGKDFEVNMSLKNAPAQENCTYWAVLIREDACGTNTSTGYTNGTKAVSGTFVQELRLLKDFGFNSTNYESETGKDELINKIQTFIGQGNGTISIGEENQSTLSLKSLGLAPGNYLLFAGAYEKEKGLAGMAQEELTISPARNEDSNSKSYSGDYNFSGITSKGQSFQLSVS